MAFVDSLQAGWCFPAVRLHVSAGFLQSPCRSHCPVSLPAPAGLQQLFAHPLQTLQIPCRRAASACSPLADPLHMPADPLPFLSRPLQASCSPLADSLQVPLAVVWQFPCSSPAGALQGAEDSCRRDPAGFLQAPCSFPADPCRSLAGLLQFDSSPPSGFLQSPCTSPGDSLQVPFQFPCSV